jgi:hypothetical protein
MPARSDWCFAHSRGPLSPCMGSLASSGHGCPRSACLVHTAAGRLRSGAAVKSTRWPPNKPAADHWRSGVTNRLRRPNRKVCPCWCRNICRPDCAHPLPCLCGRFLRTRFAVATLCSAAGSWHAFHGWRCATFCRHRRCGTPHGGDSNEQAVRFQRIHDDGVQIESTPAGMPLGPGWMPAQRLDLLPGFPSIFTAKQGSRGDGCN